MSIFLLLLATAFLQLGIGFHGILLGWRVEHKEFLITAIGYVMSSYFIGFLSHLYLSVYNAPCWPYTRLCSDGGSHLSCNHRLCNGSTP